MHTGSHHLTCLGMLLPHSASRTAPLNLAVKVMGPPFPGMVSHKPGIQGHAPVRKLTVIHAETPVREGHGRFNSFK